MEAINTWELGILQWIQEHLQCGFLDWFMPVVTRFADSGIGWILLAAVLLCIPRTRRTGTAMGLALLMGLLIGNVILKNAVARIRPYELDPTVVLLVDRLRDFSFPSGHTLASFEAATVLAVYHRKAGIAALIFAGIIGLSRLYLFVHFPTDVLTGAMLGTAIGLCSCYLVSKLWLKKGWPAK